VVSGPGRALCLGSDALEGGPDGRLPRGRDPVGPPLARDTEVGTELAGIVKPGRAVVLGEREFVGDVGHRAPDEPEADHVRPVEGDGLQRGRG
jgi:hypothetical protein